MSITNQETALGKAAFIAKQLLAGKEMLAEAKKTLGKISKMMKMANEGSEKIPGELKRYMDRFLDKLKDRNLIRAKKKEVLVRVLKSLSISPKELMMYIQRVKKDI